MIGWQSLEEMPTTLTSRRCGSTLIALTWSKATGRAVVVVEDSATGDRFELDVRPDESPLDVFEHPYAYAGSRAA
jgi:hypothetical protein